MFKLIKDINDFNSHKNDYLNFKKEYLDYIEFQENKEDYLKYKQHKDSFEFYKRAIGNDNRPFFLMYASDIDAEGNIEFSYDFNQDFVKLLKQQGITGIEDIEIIEEYMHLIFSQNYFMEMLGKQAREDK